MANFWQIATSIDTAGTRSKVQKIARESKLQRKELEKQTELLRKSSLSPEQIAAEENAKTMRQSIWTVIGSVVILLGFCIAYPIFGVIVACVIIFAIIFAIIQHKKNKRTSKEKNRVFEEKQVAEQTQKAQRQKAQQPHHAQSQTQTKVEQSISSTD